MMIKRCVVVAIIVGALAGLTTQNDSLTTQNEVRTYESALARLDNWLANNPKKPKTKSWSQDLDFIEGIAKSRKFRKGKYQELSDQKVKELVNFLPALFRKDLRGERWFHCYPESLPILGDLIAMIQEVNWTACAFSRNRCSLRRLLKDHWKRLNQCYKELYWTHFELVVAALENGEGNEPGSLSGLEIQNQIYKMRRQRWLTHLFASGRDLNGVMEAQSRLRRGENPFGTKVLLRAIGEAMHPGIDNRMKYHDEKTGAYVDLKFSKAEAKDYFEKKMKETCESYVRATRAVIEPAARFIEKEGSVYSYGGVRLAHWYLVCELVVEMRFTEEMADAVVKELERKRNRQ